MGEIALSPIGLSMVNKLTPIRFASLMMGIWYLSTATANKFAGILAGLYPEAGKGKNTLWISDCKYVRLLYGVRHYVGYCVPYSVPSLEEIAKDDAWSGIKIVFLHPTFLNNRLWTPFR